MLAMSLQQINQLPRGGNQHSSHAPRPAAHHTNSPDGGGSDGRRINDAGPLPFQQKTNGRTREHASPAPRLGGALQIPPSASRPPHNLQPRGGVRNQRPTRPRPAFTHPSASPGPPAPSSNPPAHPKVRAPRHPKSTHSAAPTVPLHWQSLIADVEPAPPPHQTKNARRRPRHKSAPGRSPSTKQEEPQTLRPKPPPTKIATPLATASCARGAGRHTSLPAANVNTVPSPARPSDRYESPRVITLLQGCPYCAHTAPLRSQSGCQPPILYLFFTPSKTKNQKKK